MTITQTVEIPDTRRIIFDVPREIPTGSTVRFDVIWFPQEKKTEPSRRELTREEEARLKVMPCGKMTAEEEKKFFEENAEWLNREAEDALLDQVDIFESGECWEDEE